MLLEAIAGCRWTTDRRPGDGPLPRDFWTPRTLYNRLYTELSASIGYGMSDADAEEARRIIQDVVVEAEHQVAHLYARGFE